MLKYLTLADYRRAVTKTPSLRDTRMDKITVRPMARRHNPIQRFCRWLTRRQGV
jgi:hypothetical protein